MPCYDFCFTIHISHFGTGPCQIYTLQSLYTDTHWSNRCWMVWFPELGLHQGRGPRWRVFNREGKGRTRVLVKANLVQNSQENSSVVWSGDLNTPSQLTHLPFAYGICHMYFVLKAEEGIQPNMMARCKLPNQTPTLTPRTASLTSWITTETVISPVPQPSPEQ